MVAFKDDLLDQEEILEYVIELCGDKFAKIFAVANDILEHPSDYVGPQASAIATQLAIYRMKLVAYGVYLKSLTGSDKVTRTRKDAVLTMCSHDGALQELINCLKLKARVEIQ
jgi:hypothetical protein